jgi:hypothetical protein
LKGNYNTGGVILKDWLRKLLSSNTEASFGRLAAAIALIFGLGWGSYIVIKRLEIPSLQGIATLVASLYGSSKLGDVVTAFKNIKGNEPPSGPAPDPPMMGRG